ncbi:acetyl-CoA carboxylase biotin carboxyl carrier protein [Scopulibacillus daqui]|uniref:Acetyl-CoA carboxylase biotin carboxyl carrier protein n=1 Tax=Scopulibacillus daqui TaxID=1469162 RepID=A0ABS2PW22_9BACL|nr:biotin/lipoyl-binding carrier protein [Scopulibacillus daqui]MBM7644252.1 acetyl-CoA carboxylase biotin carboxyl carrier protein [Scopulibacillus daqui]
MKNIQSNMTGTVLNILVAKGDQVKAGDQIAMLESMKMEIPIESTEDGVVSDVKVNAGDFVNEGDPLITLE